MSVGGSDGRELPDALRDTRALAGRMAGGPIVVFRNYDGTLTVIVKEGTDFRDLLERVTATVREQTARIRGVLVEPKKSSLAVHYRSVDERERPQVAAIVDAVVAGDPDALRVTPGKMVYEIGPRIEWDEGRAVLHLLGALGLDREEVLPRYLGDDITDEDAFRALSRRGIGILVADSAHPETEGRSTVAESVLADADEVEKFLDGLAR